MRLTITPTALQKLSDLRPNPGDSLRISVIGAGCSGLSYKLAWESAPPNPGDRTQTTEGLCLLIDPKSALYLNGLILDYSDGLTGKGFEFNNPNAKRTCGCGSSFST